MIGFLAILIDAIVMIMWLIKGEILKAIFFLGLIILLIIIEIYKEQLK